MSMTLDCLLVSALVEEDRGRGEGSVSAERHLRRRREPPKPESEAGGKGVAVSLDAETLEEMVLVFFTIHKKYAFLTLHFTSVSSMINLWGMDYAYWCFLDYIPSSWSDEGGLREVHLGRYLLLEFVGNVGGKETNGGGISG